MTELVKLNERQASPWQAHADQILASAIAGDLLLYRKGKWTRGEDDRPVALGTRLLANMEQIWTGWIRWWNGSPVEHRLNNLLECAPKILREDLGHMDQALWETDQQGIPRNPWQEVDRIIMRDITDGGLLTFSTSSWGGRKAVAKLCRDFDHGRQKHPGKYPVVELGSRDRHSADFGAVPEPIFDIINWAAWDDSTQQQAEAAKTIEAPKAKKATKAKKAEYDEASPPPLTDEELADQMDLMELIPV